MAWTKLDPYEYKLDIDKEFGITRIELDKLEDYDILTLTQDFNINEGRLYVDGHRFGYVDHETEVSTNFDGYQNMKIRVVELP